MAKLKIYLDNCCYGRPFEDNKEHILKFVNEFSSFFISEKSEARIKAVSDEITATGIKYKDSVHLACSIIAGCDYFITTDDRVLKFKTDRIKIVNPIEFVKLWEEMI
jgi:predicted nucleic acid-binding protein